MPLAIHRLHAHYLRRTGSFALLLLMVSLPLWGQTPYHGVNKQRNQVVAVSGLNLRDAPGIHGRILTKVPFREQVRIISDSAYAFESVNDPEVMQQNYWLKATYGGHTGYLFDAYFYYPAKTESGNNFGRTPPGLNEQYRLFVNGGSVHLSSHFDYEWFGLYPAGKNDCLLRAISPSYRYEPGEIEENISMTVNDGSSPHFFIGTKKGLKAGRRPGEVIYAEGTSEQMDASLTAICQRHNIDKQPATVASWSSAYQLTLVAGDQRQLFGLDGLTGSAFAIEAATDFDGDGKTDFIISFDALYYDSSLLYVLFLSSEAWPGELLRPVALQYVYNGC